MKDEINFGAGFVLGALTVILLAISGKGRRRIKGDWTFVDPDSQIKITSKGVFKMELREGQEVQVSVGNFRTRSGHAAAIEAGSGRWTSTDESIVSVTQDPSDETKATAKGLDGSNNETVAVEFRADGRPGEGVREIVMSGAVTCTQGDAATGDLSFGTPADSEVGGEGSGNIPADTSGANEGVDMNPSAGSGAGDAAGTTAPSDSNQPADQGGDVPTVQNAGGVQDTAADGSEPV